MNLVYFDSCPDNKHDFTSRLMWISNDPDEDRMIRHKTCSKCGTQVFEPPGGAKVIGYWTASAESYEKGEN